MPTRSSVGQTDERIWRPSCSDRIGPKRSSSEDTLFIGHRATAASRVQDSTREVEPAGHRYVFLISH